MPLTKLCPQCAAGRNHRGSVCTACGYVFVKKGKVRKKILMRAVRANESEEEREARRAKNRIAMANARARETEKEREARRARNRRVMKARRKRQKTSSSAEASTASMTPSSPPKEVTSNVPVNGNEAKYCFCERGPFGEMVGCDNLECLVEWFHFECVGLTEQPKGEWYCPQCSQHNNDRKK
ncbi:inhibitor of growth protein 4-like [Corticium candelabrum]|uniref:inhibitor of growth protein 4-like n=1 Tax=Corticium candelabrum TaxID=121492 RepID=UPI002E26FC54|nr:inhibitor of growth protein 4-like [Corticium candelabrum]